MKYIYIKLWAIIIMCKFVELEVLCDKFSIGALNYYSGGCGFEYNQSLLQDRISSSPIKKK